MSWRRLGVLIDHLPPESATRTAMREAMTDEDWANLPAPVGHGPWSQTELLLASVADGIALLIHQQARLHGSDGPPPDPLPRPGVRPKAAALTPKARQFLEDRRRAHNERTSSG